MFRIRSAAHRLTIAPSSRRLASLLAAPRVHCTVPRFTAGLPRPAIVIAHRSLATLTENEIKKRLDDFQDLFVEARLSIEDCNDSAGTTYYEEDVEVAIEAVDEAVGTFQKLIADIDDETEKNRILRGNGLKVEQLKGELEMALKEGGDHH